MGITRQDRFTSPLVQSPRTWIDTRARLKQREREQARVAETRALHRQAAERCRIVNIVSFTLLFAGFLTVAVLGQLGAIGGLGAVGGGALAGWASQVLLVSVVLSLFRRWIKGTRMNRRIVRPGLESVIDNAICGRSAGAFYKSLAACMIVGAWTLALDAPLLAQLVARDTVDVASLAEHMHVVARWFGAAGPGPDGAIFGQAVQVGGALSEAGFWLFFLLVFLVGAALALAAVALHALGVLVVWQVVIGRGVRALALRLSSLDGSGTPRLGDQLLAAAGETLRAAAAMLVVTGLTSTSALYFHAYGVPAPISWAVNAVGVLLAALLALLAVVGLASMRRSRADQAAEQAYQRFLKRTFREWSEGRGDEWALRAEIERRGFAGRVEAICRSVDGFISLLERVRDDDAFRQQYLESLGGTDG